MGFGSDDQGTQAGIPAGIDAHFFHHFIQASGIARNGMQGRCAEIGDELDLPFGVSGSSRNGEHAQAFGTVLKAQTAGEHAVAGRVLEDVSLAQSDHIEAAGYGVGPFVKVVLCVQDDGGSAGGTAGRMEAYDLFQRNGRESEGIVVAQILLGGKREFPYVVEGSDIFRPESAGSEPLFIEGNAHTAGKGLLQSFHLQLLQSGAGERLQLGV